MEKEVFAVYYGGMVRGVYEDLTQAIQQVFKEVEIDFCDPEYQDGLEELEETIKHGLKAFREGLDEFVGYECDYDVIPTKLFVVEG